MVLRSRSITSSSDKHLLIQEDLSMFVFAERILGAVVHNHVHECTMGKGFACCGERDGVFVFLPRTVGHFRTEAIRLLSVRKNRPDSPLSIPMKNASRCEMRNLISTGVPNSASGAAHRSRYRISSVFICNAANRVWNVILLVLRVDGSCGRLWRTPPVLQ